MRKQILRVTMVCVLGLGVNAFAADVVWDGSESNLWRVGDNWSTGSVPDSGYTTYIGDNDGTDTVLIDSSTTAVCSTLKISYLSSNSTTYTLNMTGGTLNTTGTRSSIGDTAVGKAVFNLSDGAATFNDRIMLGDHGHGEINMSGGTLGSNVGINMGCRGGTSGDIYLSDGTITVPSIWLGDDGGATAILEVTGGAINLSDTLYVNTYSSGSLGGMMSLDGGVVTASALSMVNADDVAGTLDIAGGTLILDGEIDSSWQYYVDGWVTANGGTGTLDFDYDSGSDTTTITAVPEPATMGLLALGGLGVLIRRKR